MISILVTYIVLVGLNLNTTFQRRALIFLSIFHFMMYRFYDTTSSGIDGIWAMWISTLGAVWLPDRLEQPEGIQMCFLVCLCWTSLNVTALLKFLVTLLVWLKGWESWLLSQSAHHFCLEWNIAATIRWDILLAFSLSRRWLPVNLFTPWFSSVLP